MKEISTQMGLFPMPVALLGANVDGKANFMPISGIAQVNMQPFIIALGIGKPHHTTRGIKENKTFSINFPTVEMIEKVDYSGIFSGQDIDKTKVFDVSYGKLGNAPLIQECSVSLEFKVINIIDLPGNFLVLGEIAAAWSEDKYLSDGKPDPEKMNLFTLTMPDNSYWAMGKRIGGAWDIGKDYSPK